MPETNFRALCAELVSAIDRLTSHGGSPGHPDIRLILTVDIEDLEELADSARAALSQPAPEPPTGKELTALVRVFQSAYNTKRSELRALPNPYREGTASDMADHAGISAVLARWGQGND
jgi:hypothetical protein